MKAAKIKLPFGLNENNIIVHITNVESNEECNCICPNCKSPLIAVKGKIKQHHFRHKNVNECKGGLESTIHQAAKQIIMERKKITLPKYICTASALDSKGLKQTEHKIFLPDSKIIYFDSIEEEKFLYGMQADLLGKKANKSLIIEIYYRHNVDAQKIEKIKNANISAIEINLSELAPEDVKNPEAFWAYINDSNHVQWLYNAKANECFYPELVDQVAVKIQKIEKKYDALKVQAKTTLEQASKTLKILRSKKYTAQPIRKIKLNPIWQMHESRLPYSLEELPTFLNTYVADGDWIFGCDRRIWQVMIYNTFICNNNRQPFFCIRQVASYITLYCQIPRCVEILHELGKCFPDLVPSEVSESLPSPFETLQVYFSHLHDLGMLELSRSDSSQKKNIEFRVVSTKPDSTLFK